MRFSIIGQLTSSTTPLTHFLGFFNFSFFYFDSFTVLVCHRNIGSLYTLLIQRSKTVGFGFWVYGTSGYRGYTEWRVEIQREKEGAWGRGHFWNPNGRVWVWGYWFCLLVLRWPSTLFYSSYNPQIILFIMITTHTSLFLSL